MSVVTPLEVAASAGRSVWLRDRAISAGLAEAKTTQYDVAFLYADGDEAAPAKRVPAAGELMVVELPKAFLTGPVVIHVRAVRDGVVAPRACDVHMMADQSTARVIGIRH